MRQRLQLQVCCSVNPQLYNHKPVTKCFCNTPRRFVEAFWTGFVAGAGGGAGGADAVALAVSYPGFRAHFCGVLHVVSLFAGICEFLLPHFEPQQALGWLRCCSALITHLCPQGGGGGDCGKCDGGL